MCDFCDEDGPKKAEYFAQRLERLASLYRQIAGGYIKPHSKEMDPVTWQAKGILCRLVEDWV